jgi:L-threonylcarbamoyladenylate synthase
MTRTITSEKLKDKTYFEKSKFALLTELQGGKILCAALENGYVYMAYPYSQGAVERFREITQSDEDTFFPVLIPDLTTMESLTPTHSPELKLLAATFWPGPMNVIAPLLPGLNINLGAKTYPSNIYCRVPSSKFLRELLGLVGPLIYATAPQITGQAARQVADIAPKIKKQIDIIVDSGRCRYAKPATTISFAVQPPKIMRHGIIDETKLRGVLQHLSD